MSEIIQEIKKTKLLTMYRKMVTIRKFEEKVRSLFLKGIMPGTIHQYDGQEACAVGVCSLLAEGDTITSTHRPHGHALARGLTPKELMAELFGKEKGCCKGKGGSMHVGNLKKGMLPAIAIVGANIPITTGIGLSYKLKDENNVAISFFGDGASNHGAFHEGINLAAAYDIPAVFVCENNFYGASTHVSMVNNVDNIADKSAAYGIEGVVADGNDVLEVYKNAKRLIRKAREGKGPSILELKTYRRCGHSRRDPNAYRDEEEEEYWMNRDPIPMFRNKLYENKICKQEELNEIDNEVNKQINEAVKYARSLPSQNKENALKDVFVE